MQQFFVDAGNECNGTSGNSGYNICTAHGDSFQVKENIIFSAPHDQSTWNGGVLLSTLRSMPRKCRNVSPRKPRRMVSNGITSLGAMLPRLTLAPNNLINHTCCA